MRTVANIHVLSLDAASGSISAAGDPLHLAIGAWITSRLDVPAGPANQQAEFGGLTYSIYTLQHAIGNVGLQEIITTVRTVAQMQHIFMVSARRAIVFSGTPAEAAMTSWMIAHLDVTPATPPAATVEYQDPGAPEDAVRIFYLPAAITAESRQNLMVALRTTGGITRVYSTSQSLALAVRDTPARMAKAERLIAGWVAP